MTKKERALKILEAFEKEYPDAICSLNYSKPHELLIATQLSAQCTDARVNIVAGPLFERYKTIDDFADADYDELCEYIRSTGFYRNKAKNIIACCKRLRDVYSGEVPGNMEDLLTLAGTGRKTANLVLGDVFGKPAVVVDTHCIRIANRMGLTTNKEPEKIEQDLKKLLPPDKSADFCHRIVLHGRAVCSARKADCENCVVREYCKKKGIEKKNK
ncbi:MAG: endonuclease III [Clostridia bacterium]|nr:endonuclease III [Clostridia bacterium]